MRSALSILLVFLLPMISSAAESPVYERDVRPILKAHCFHCHGEEDEVQGKLDLRLVRGMLKGGESGAAFVVGQSAKSLLVERIESGEMPPGNKKLTAAELATIRHWIDGGAKVARPEPETPTALDDLTDEERNFWSFQPIRRPALPPVTKPQLLRSSLDAFVLAELERHQLEFAQPADRRTLIRRLAFDLHGLPPDVEAVERFAANDSTDAYERLVDELLASPRYGERWGRHWLDVAGYADSDGYTEQDPERKYAYKFRDYVIRAFNADKPWDQFIVEQLAGDELLQPPFANLSPEQAEQLMATGFLRMGPDGTGIGGVDQNAARNEVIAETIKIVSSSLLGLSVGCAQCHNHRYDPISQVDYFRVRALFEPAYDWKNWRVPNARLVSLWTDEIRQRASAVDAETKELTAERLKILDGIVQEVFEREVAKLPEEQRELAKVARDTAEKERTPEQKQLLKDHPSLKVDRGSVYLYERKRVDEHNKSFDARQAAIKAKRPPEDYVACLTEVPGKIPATQLFFRGDFNSPRQEVEPGELAVLKSSAAAAIPKDDPQLPTSGRRLAYARQLTSGQHPLVARVLVNRFWMHHFGRGLVATPSDFGRLGARPTHPELLDWLASEFMTNGWSLKQLHRLIVNSTTYQQSSRRSPAQDAIDPENRLLARMNVRRLDAESLRDSMLSVSGKLCGEMFGSPVPIMPDEVGQIIVGVDTRDTAGRPTGKFVPIHQAEFRRSLYVQMRRTTPLSLLETFDAPDMRPNCELRNSSTVSPQSLLLMNNEFVIAQATEMALQLEAQTADRTAQVTQAWRLTSGHAPQEAQLEAALKFLDAQAAELTAVKLVEKSKTPELSPATKALASYCQALLSSNRFLYVD